MLCLRFARSFHSNGLDKNVGLIGLLNDLESTKDVEQILKTGVSRVRRVFIIWFQFHDCHIFFCSF